MVVLPIFAQYPEDSKAIYDFESWIDDCLAAMQQINEKMTDDLSNAVPACIHIVKDMRNLCILTSHLFNQFQFIIKAQLSLIENLVDNKLPAIIDKYSTILKSLSQLPQTSKYNRIGSLTERIELRFRLISKVNEEIRKYARMQSRIGTQQAKTWAWAQQSLANFDSVADKLFAVKLSCSRCLCKYNTLVDDKPLFFAEPGITRLVRLHEDVSMTVDFTYLADIDFETDYKLLKNEILHIEAKRLKSLR